MSKYYMSIDQGTTGTTVMLVDAKTLKVIDKVNEEFPQIFPKPSWVEHNLEDIWNTVESCTKKVLEKTGINSKDILSIGITNQRETTCAYDKNGKQLHNAIVWQDRRTSNYCRDKAESYQPLKDKTGLPLDPYFSGTKMNWLLQNSEEVKAAHKNNDLHLSTIDTYLLYKLTGSFKTDTTNASRTLLMDLKTCNWDDELLSFFEVPKDTLPEICESISEFGKTTSLNFLPDGIPVNCILGDQQAALFGQAGQKEGSLKSTYGTGAFIVLNTGEKIVKSSNGLLTTLAYSYKGKHYYALEGSAYIAGAAVQWLRDNLNIIESSPDVEKLANEITNTEDTEHILFMPFFTGIGSPYWNPDAKAAIIGLTRDSGKAHIARACLEGIALSINDSIKSLTQDYSGSVEEIRVDGGASLNNLLMQLQADFSNKKIIRPKVIETTAYGVALGCAIGTGALDINNVDSVWQEDCVFEARPNDYHQKKSSMWDNTIKALF
jgi:glycerol kinase